MEGGYQEMEEQRKKRMMYSKSGSFPPCLDRGFTWHETLSFSCGFFPSPLLTSPHSLPPLQPLSPEPVPNPVARLRPHLQHPLHGPLHRRQELEQRHGRGPRGPKQRVSLQGQLAE
jgi:hypothetical protein